MREILFKAKREDNGKWVEGFVFEFKNKFYITEMAQTFMTAYYTEKSVVDFNMRAYEIDPETLCQYTGLTDKNGKKILENDIVTITIECDDYFNLSETGIVEYSYGQYELKVKTTDGKEAYSNLINKLSEAPFEIEKLGNIFDNPDLLEVE